MWKYTTCCCVLQGSHASWKVLEKTGYYLLKIPGPGKSWKILDIIFENSRTWKVLENHFGPGNSWKLTLKVLESPGKILLKFVHFSSGSSGNRQQ